MRVLDVFPFTLILFVKGAFLLKILNQVIVRFITRDIKISLIIFTLMGSLANTVERSNKRATSLVLVALFFFCLKIEEICDYDRCIKIFP